MLTAEFRHMDGISGNFSIVDGRDYQATAAVNEGDPPNESVYALQGYLWISNTSYLICYGTRQFLQNRE